MHNKLMYIVRKMFCEAQAGTCTKDIPGSLWSVQVYFGIIGLCTLKTVGVDKFSFYQPNA